MRQYTKRDLYGGAIVCDLPSNFADVSDIRQVPDNQEVWLDANGYTSIIFDILERVNMPTDYEALDFHVLDSVGQEDMARTTVWMRGDAHFSKLPPNTTCLTFLATTPAGENDRGRSNNADFSGLLVTLVRLEQQSTDIVISINVPHLPTEYVAEDVDVSSGKLGPLLQQAVELRERVTESFDIKEWGLFVE
ncbi:Mog1p/PsbP-like protein [Polychaeton citri CBS 116435]|uniref:Mog1p/PsbP-like protein n=1 Tax=Polychaeton citri CBS 116435 TaxID=1314669 RepID=A0A9P4QEJ8_9PEZI|nr:Mog1p/PsbP-like protein [Polychaeton citri CBS 116435]